MGLRDGIPVGENLQKIADIIFMAVTGTGVMVANPEDIDIDEGDDDEEMAEAVDAVEERAVPVRPF